MEAERGTGADEGLVLASSQVFLVPFNDTKPKALRRARFTDDGVLEVRTGEGLWQYVVVATGHCCMRGCETSTCVLLLHLVSGCVWRGCQIWRCSPCG